MKHMAEVKTKRAGKPAGKLRMEMEHADNGGYMVKHHFPMTEAGYKEPESHAFGAKEGKKMLAHIAEHMGMKAEAAEEKAEE